MFILQMSFQETVQKGIHYFLQSLLFTELTLHKPTEICRSDYMSLTPKFSY